MRAKHQAAESRPHDKGQQHEATPNEICPGRRRAGHDRAAEAARPWHRLLVAGQARGQLQVFAQGEMVAESDDGVVGYAGSLIVRWDDWAEAHSWHDITGAGTLEHHDPTGRTRYGAEVFVDPALQGSGLGHLLHEARRNLCRAMNLKRIMACGRLPGYHWHAQTLSAEAWAQRLVWGELRDPELSLQLREGFSYCGVIAGYIPEDSGSCGFASIIVWLNPDYEPHRDRPSSPRRLPSDRSHCRCSIPAAPDRRWVGTSRTRFTARAGSARSGTPTRATSCACSTPRSARSRS